MFLLKWLVVGKFILTLFFLIPFLYFLIIFNFGVLSKNYNNSVFFIIPILYNSDTYYIHPYDNEKVFNNVLTNNEVPIKFYLFFSFMLFFLGILGIIFNRKNIVNLMLCIELMLFSASLNFIFFSMYLESISGQIFALIIIAIAAADSAVGLGLLIAAFYLKRNIAFEAFSSLKG